jgi:hypothetical protein
MVPKMQEYFDSVFAIDGVMNCWALRKFMDLVDGSKIINLEERSDASEQSDITRKASIFSIGSVQL